MMRFIRKLNLALLLGHCLEIDGWLKKEC